MKMKKFLQSIKFDKRFKIRISNKTNVIGYLKPIGFEYIRDSDVFKDLYKWRKKNINFFFKQERINLNSVKKFLIKNYIYSESNILFFILDDEKKRIGHIGISNIRKNNADLDNLIRGEPGGGKEIIYNAEKTLLSWIFSNFNVKKISGRIRSDNYIALNIHQNFGFKITKSRYLKIVKNNNLIKHIFTNQKGSNLDYKMCYIRLYKDDFKKNCYFN